MITKIEVKNVKAINNCEINFNKSKYQYREDMIFNEHYVNPIAFYGANGSGKSSILESVLQLTLLLNNEPDNIYPLVPNFVNFGLVVPQKENYKYSKNISSYVKLFFTLNEKTEYIYKIETKLYPREIVSEVLIKNGEIVFDRKITKYKYRNKEFDVQSPLFPTLRALYSEHNDETITECFNFLSNIAFLDASTKRYKFKAALQKNYLDIIVEKSAEIKSILNKYKEFPLYDVFSNTSELGEKDYLASIKLDKGELILPYGYISSGMSNQNVILAALLSLPKNGVLIIDEIEDALHPLTILDFLKVVKEKNIQLIFSSHNTFILQKLRPDQIYFANWKNGFSSYKRLSDIYPNIREINNIEKMYLSNYFEEDIKKDG